MKSRNGFTLIELLAVIVILAILLAIAIPRVTQYITNSRKNSFVTTTRDFVDSIRTDAIGEIYDFPISNSDVTIVSINMVGLEKGGTKSAFNGRWIQDSSYVAIINVGTDIDPVYNYYVALSDSKKYTIPLTLDEKINTASIVRNNLQNRVRITPMCGSEEGKYMIINDIAGLEAYRPKNGWNATIYSSDGC